MSLNQDKQQEKTEAKKRILLNKNKKYKRTQKCVSRFSTK